MLVVGFFILTLNRKENGMKNSLNEKQAAKILCVAVQTLRNWRHQRRGPIYLKLGRSVRYKYEDMENYIEKKRINPEA